ncbi:MAG: hypothetical protein SGJ19_21405 [Planctomycetia bacterium]|nr:hypothetical protein [Planctomycetia bacterium]
MAAAKVCYTESTTDRAAVLQSPPGRLIRGDPKQPGIQRVNHMGKGNNSQKNDKKNKKPKQGGAKKPDSKQSSGKS